MATRKIRIKLASYDTGLIDNVVSRILDTATKSGCKVSGPIPLPTKKEVVTILRSTHVNKDSREQFESRTHFRLIDVYAPNQKAIDTVLKMNVPSGVDIKVEL
ncbi:MAG TPA: 30S ribosomal protein S10 [Candidatus Onthoplasma faecipullorum]|nr:30S ribosomal protein S10 [Candidatus Onthoplasma faecipullorum]